MLEYQIKYFKPAYYDEELRIETKIEEVKGARIYFSYTTFNEANEALNKATTTLVFVDYETKRPMNPPKDLLEVLSQAADNIS